MRGRNRVIETEKENGCVCVSRRRWLKCMFIYSLPSWQHALSTLLFHPHLPNLTHPHTPNTPILRPWGISRVATTNPTWHAGDGAIWSRPRLAIGPAVSTHSASVVLFNERIWANIWLPGGVAATPCRPGGVLPLPFKPGGIKGGPWISKVTKP